MHILPVLLTAPLVAQVAQSDLHAPIIGLRSASPEQVQPVIYPGRTYRQDLKAPELGRAYTPHPELVAYVQTLAAAARDRVRIFTTNTTEEGRPQLLLAISSPDNLRRLESLKAANARLADPRTLTEPMARAIIQEHPVFVWLGYSVHGSEPAGSEAALAVAYHFAACEDPEVQTQLERTVLLLDLTQNPDGRARHIQAVAEALQGENPPDPQDAQNQPRWPSGRFNHRLFDLNRDWVWQTQKETRAKVAQFLAWNPQVLADHHEMQPERNYFFPPNMQPLHEALPESAGGSWQAAFGEALGKAFDAQGFAFFTRDQYDLFYPSYGDSWSSFQGAVGMTFECPNPGGLAYLRKDGELLTLAGRVRRHLTATLAAVGLASEKRAQLLESFYRARKERLQTGDRAGAFLVGEGTDPGRALALVKVLQRNGIEVLRTKEALSAAALDPIALGATPAQVPAGSYLVPLDQPRAPLAMALLEKEAHMGPIPSYDLTAWSLPLLYQVPAWFAKARPRVGTEAVVDRPPAPLLQARFAYLLPAGVEGRERLLEALLKEGFRGSVSERTFSCNGKTFQAGTAIFPRHLNGGERLDSRLAALCSTLDGNLGASVVCLDSSRVEMGPDLGSDRGLILKSPKVALIMDSPTSPTAVGGVMHALLENGIPFTQLRAQRLAGADLRTYTHVILVDDDGQGKGYQAELGAAGAACLKAYAQDGGVLIAMRGGAAFASRNGLCDTPCHFLSQRAEEARLKEKDARHESSAPELGERTAPWASREDRQLKESVPGVLLHARVDGTHPLAWGLNASEAAILDDSDVVLELSPGGENPIHYAKEKLRLSGLLAPGLEMKLQQTAYLVREHRGKGAIVLFAGDPVFRGHQPFTSRAFLNTLFFGAYAGSGAEE